MKRLNTHAFLMHSRGPTKLLLPVSSWFITFTLLCGFLLNLLPWGHWIGVPDWLALVIVFWSMHQPRKVGIGAAFFLGLCMDVHEATLLGEHALAYSLLSYAAIALHRRILWFALAGQMLHLLPMLLSAQLTVMVVRILNGATWPGLGFFLDCLSATLLWPLASWLLLAPQRRPPVKDETRPL
jgi:rod shape-determining protein MreD